MGAGKKLGGISRTQSTLIVVEDLVHLRPPLTEYALLKNLHERFDRSQFYVRGNGMSCMIIDLEISLIVLIIGLDAIGTSSGQRQSVC